MSKKLQSIFEIEVGGGGHNTPGFNSMYRKATNEIKKLLSDVAEEFKFNKGHFYFSGFFKRKSDGQAFYLSITDARFCIDKILIRTAKHYKDFTGGGNNYVSIPNFEVEAKNIIKNQL
ncbi:MAG: hypothetical protein M0P94_04970 [Candidatus Absconditabacterales bacterium]|nr:hypothetical protein [Candidatus Absconditabacterales bacterium]